MSTWPCGRCDQLTLVRVQRTGHAMPSPSLLHRSRGRTYQPCRRARRESRSCSGIARPFSKTSAKALRARFACRARHHRDPRRRSRRTEVQDSAQETHRRRLRIARRCALLVRTRAVVHIHEIVVGGPAHKLPHIPGDTHLSIGRGPQRARQPAIVFRPAFAVPSIPPDQRVPVRQKAHGQCRLADACWVVWETNNVSGQVALGRAVRDLCV